MTSDSAACSASGGRPAIGISGVGGGARCLRTRRSDLMAEPTAEVSPEEGDSSAGGISDGSDGKRKEADAYGSDDE